MLPKIAITMGDPAGVGPEVCLAALCEPTIQDVCCPIIFGNSNVMSACAEALGSTARFERLSWTEFQTNSNRIYRPTVVDCFSMSGVSFKPGFISAFTGEASFQSIQRAIDAALKGFVAGVTTAPINKEAIHLAGHNYPGHTEMFAERCDSNRSCMMQFSDEITCTFVTVHCGYADVNQLLTQQRIVEVIELTTEAMWRLHNRKPKLVVCGLNPHAGEHGLFGDREEERIILPAIESCRNDRSEIEGPIPADTAFLPWKRASTDAFICMYHDQGHIPVKALAFDRAVNTTLGISIIRTSVDHGTALDIAWQGKANPGSMFAAIKLAVRLGDPKPVDDRV